jgi:hypothetical protein
MYQLIELYNQLGCPKLYLPSFPPSLFSSLLSTPYFLLIALVTKKKHSATVED